MSRFTASGGPDLAGKLIANTDGWTYDFAQQGYLSGWVAGNPERARRIAAHVIMNLRRRSGDLVSTDNRRGRLPTHEGLT